MRWRAALPQPLALFLVLQQMINLLGQGIRVKEVHQLALIATGDHFFDRGVALATMQQPLAMASIKLQLKMKGTVQYT